MNANDVEDRSYLIGLPASTAQPTGEETWFGVFIRVQNTTDKTIAPANDFEIVDTQENVYRPIPLDTNVNPFAYKPDPIAPKSLIPEPDSVASEGTIQGSLLLFKLKTESLRTARSSSASSADRARRASSTSTSSERRPSAALRRVRHGSASRLVLQRAPR